ncbi:hypothetical protein L1787_15115 [Acuticoccus sp. M5D2P5]|uniref:hypothetical protein n=1 Tax=Acuticoccus kalidii TaxID=2910977 RepID=UPI001F3FEF3B|nr:hypothetical protein [Acuticoccus kalidii]MCF3934731.1 hypothetical protein [Acuticoccus kalidii]
MTKRILSAAALATVMVASPAFAETAERFQIVPVGETVLRLDRVTGAIELCAEADGGAWRCNEVVAPVPLSRGEAATALADENASLKARVTELERRLNEIGALVEGYDADKAADEAASVRLRSEARRGIDEAIDVTEYAVRRFRNLYDALTSDEVQ